MMKNVYLGKMNDIDAVKRCNAEKIRLYDLKDFNYRLLETTIYKNESYRYPAHSGPWAIFGVKNVKMGQFIETIRYGIPRVADLKALGLSDYIGEKNVAFFIPVIPDIGNGKPSLEFVQDGKSQLIVANEPAKIVVVQNMPRDGTQLSDKDYENLVGFSHTYDINLYFDLRDGSGNFLLRRGDVFVDGCRHDVNGNLWDSPLGVQGDYSLGD